MTRILADLPDEDIYWLDRTAVERGMSRAAVLREAVTTLKLQAPTIGALEQGFGLWARHGVAIDPDYERKRRAEWTRPWDDDFEEVRAESPDCFTEYDDRERAHYLALTRRAAERRRSGGA